MVQVLSRFPRCTEGGAGGAFIGLQFQPIFHSLHIESFTENVCLHNKHLNEEICFVEEM